MAHSVTAARSPIEKRDVVWLVRALCRLGDFYWTPEGPSGRTRSEFRALADSGWRESLVTFTGYGFERAGASPHYAPAARAAVRAYSGSSPGPEFEQTVWQDFLARIGARADGKGANAKLNPLAPSTGAALSITAFVAGLGGDSYNLIGWARNTLAAERAEEAYRRLLAVRGLGPKIVPFFLRDVAAAFELDEEPLDPARYLQPIDVWTRRGAQALAPQVGLSSPVDDRAAAPIIVEASRSVGVPPSLLNTGLWLFGALFARREQTYLEALASAAAFHRFLDERRESLGAQVAALEHALEP